MTTGKNTYDEDLSASYFDAMVELQKEVQALNLPYAPCTELSMGQKINKNPECISVRDFPQKYHLLSFAFFINKTTDTTTNNNSMPPTATTAIQK